MQSKTSVIITSHNYAEYLPHAINSALMQTLKPIEVIVVDDASNDGTTRLQYGYTTKVTWIRVEYANAQKARNHGLKMAVGDYVIFLDGDDYLEVNAIEVMQKAIESDDRINLVYSDRFNFGNSDVLKQMSYSDVHIAGEFSLKRLHRWNFISITSMLRRSAFGGFDINIHRFQDWDAWLSFIDNGYQVKYVSTPLFHARMHGKNKSLYSNEFIERLKIMTKHNIIAGKQVIESNKTTKKIIYTNIYLILHTCLDLERLNYLINHRRLKVEKIFLSTALSGNYSYLNDNICKTTVIDTCEESFHAIDINSILSFIDAVFVGQITPDTDINVNDSGNAVVYTDVDYLLSSNKFENNEYVLLNKTAVLRLLYYFKKNDKLSRAFQAFINIYNRHIGWRTGNKCN